MPKADVPTSEPQGEAEATADVVGSFTIEVVRGTLDSLQKSVTVISEAASVIREAMQLSLQAGAGLAGIRTVTAAPGINNIQALLDQGWEILHLSFCDEVRETSAVRGRAISTQWVPYAILGKRGELAASDRQGIAADAERQLLEHASPLTAGQAEVPGGSEEGPADSARPQALGHQVEPHRTQTVPPDFEPTGGLKH